MVSSGAHLCSCEAGIFRAARFAGASADISPRRAVKCLVVEGKLLPVLQGRDDLLLTALPHVQHVVAVIFNVPRMPPTPPSSRSSPSVPSKSPTSLLMPGSMGEDLNFECTMPPENVRTCATCSTSILQAVGSLSDPESTCLCGPSRRCQSTLAANCTLWLYALQVSASCMQALSLHSAIVSHQSRQSNCPGSYQPYSDPFSAAKTLPQQITLLAGLLEGCQGA